MITGAVAQSAPLPLDPFIAKTFVRPEVRAHSWHNGSLMAVISESDPKADPKVMIVYEQPRPGMQVEGVVPGMPLVMGVWEGKTFVGEAYVFQAGCRYPFPYPVRGAVEGPNLILIGPAPVVAQCQIIAYTQFSDNSRLVFSAAK